MKRVALTCIGKDKPGIVASVTEVLYKLGCNIEDSSMTILEGEFAIIMIISVPEKVKFDDFLQAFEGLRKKLKLHITAKELKGVKPLQRKKPKNLFMISVLGIDHPGIVHKVSKMLANNKINITDLNTKLIGDPKKPVYAMIIESSFPNKSIEKKIEQNLQKLARQLKVDITLKPIEDLRL